MKKSKRKTWEQGFIGKKGVVVSTVTKDPFGNGLITVERDTQFFHFPAITKGEIVCEGDKIEIIEEINNKFCVKKAPSMN